MGLAVVLPAVAGAASITIPTHIDVISSDDGISRPDYSRYKAMAYPAPHVTPAQSAAARAAFRNLAAAAGGSERAWELQTPEINFVPGPVTYTGGATNASGRTTALALTPGCADQRQGPCRAYLGAAGGGIWMAENPFGAEVRWQLASTGLESNAIGSIAVDPKGRGQVIYAGTGEQNASGDSEAGLGLYKSVDGGRTWQLLTASAPFATGLSVAAVTIDPRNSKHVYFGTSAALHGAAASADASLPPGTADVGLFESTDGGATFQRVLDTQQQYAFTGGVVQIDLDPSDLDTVYISLFGIGVFRSSAALDGDTNFYPVFITAPVDAAFPKPRPYDGFNRTTFALAKVGKTTRIYLGDANDADQTSGLYRVDNARVPATRLSNPTTGADPGWTVLSSPNPGDPGYASYGFCESQCFYDLYVVSPPGHPDTVWFGGSMNYDEIFGFVAPASNGRAVMRSTDAGVHFTDMTRDARTPTLGMHPDQHALVFNPLRVDQVLAASDGGVVRTSGRLVNAAAGCASRGLTGPDLVDCQTWLAAVPAEIDPVNRGLATLQFQSLSLDPRNPAEVWQGGTQDNGTWAFAATNNAFFESVGGDGGQSGFDAVAPHTRFHSYYGTGIDVNFHGAAVSGWDYVGQPLAASNESGAFYLPIIADPVVGGTIFAGQQHLWRTQDSGGVAADLDLHCNEITGDFPATYTCGDWVAVGPVLAPTPPVDPTTGQPTAPPEYLAWVERSSGDRDTLWAATNHGKVYLSRNAAAADPTKVTFVEIDGTAASPVTTPNRGVSDIAIDPTNGRHAWVAYTGYGSNTPSAPGHVFEVHVTDKGLATFTDISYNLGDMPITALVRDDRTRTLYAGTDFGVVELRYGSKTWSTLGSGLPPAAVYHLGLSSSSGLLYAATHGRSAWRIALH